MAPDLLVMLGVPAGATDAEVETAYLRACQIWRSRRLGASTLEVRAQAEGEERIIRSAYDAWKGNDLPVEGLPPAHKRAQALSESPGPTDNPGVAEANFRTVRISPGKFQMGSPGHEKGRSEDEAPHQVRISVAFRMMTTLVTQAHWYRMMGNNPSHFSGGPDLPVECVTWFDAVAYANTLSAAHGLPRAYTITSISGTPGTGAYRCEVVSMSRLAPQETLGWRLPTEAEWEYACRAGSSTPWPFGADPCELRHHAWFGSNSHFRTHDVGQKPSNNWELCDMTGNLFEWCEDWFGPYSGSGDDPTGPTSGWGKVIRGGAWSSVASDTRTASRNANDPASRRPTIGFRLVRSCSLSDGLSNDPL